MEKRKCELCDNHAVGNQRLCSKHHKRYQRERPETGRSVQEYIDFEKQPLGDALKKLPTITAENAEEQKLIGQAMKEREHAIRLEMENSRKMGDLVSKSENKSAVVSILRGVAEQIETGLDAWPLEFENKSAGEIKKIMVKKVEQLNKSIVEMLENV